MAVTKEQLEARQSALLLGCLQLREQVGDLESRLASTRETLARTEGSARETAYWLDSLDEVARDKVQPADS
jgi:hypothetical protein